MTKPVPTPTGRRNSPERQQLDRLAWLMKLAMRGDATGLEALAHAIEAQGYGTAEENLRELKAAFKPTPP